MLKDVNLPNVYWKEVVHIFVYILNKILVRVNHTNNPYELCHGRSPTIKYFRIFGRKCYIRRHEEDLGKIDVRLYEGILLGYSTKRK